MESRYDNHTMTVFLFCKPIQSQPYVKHHASQVTYLRFASAMFIYRKYHLYDM